LFPRSSIFRKELLLTNCVGVVDADYRGEVFFKFALRDRRSHVYQNGERIGQMIIMPIPAVEFVEAEELSKTERGTGGYGSTGR
jgi:dUTP pyrophosphatase